MLQSLHHLSCPSVLLHPCAQGYLSAIAWLLHCLHGSFEVPRKLL
uniref:Uncharacterized protein n=1 Tax=Trichinella nativa TaxID=6335 RepID=A0A0V1KJD9_9BILA